MTLREGLPTPSVPTGGTPESSLASWRASRPFPAIQEGHPILQESLSTLRESLPTLRESLPTLRESLPTLREGLPTTPGPRGEPLDRLGRPADPLG